MFIFISLNVPVRDYERRKSLLHRTVLERKVAGSIPNDIIAFHNNNNNNSVAIVGERTIPTERPLVAGEVSVNCVAW
jgi:hypothetical protein